MNIFALDVRPDLAAQYHGDKHVVKMVLETAQLLSTAHHVLNAANVPEGIYKPTHANHPSAVWVRESNWNYIWTYRLFVNLLREYEHRYRRVHACNRLRGQLEGVPQPLASTGWDHMLTPITPAMPDEAKLYPNPFTFRESVDNYRNYYRNHKQAMHVWTRRPKPEWI